MGSSEDSWNGGCLQLVECKHINLRNNPDGSHPLQTRSNGERGFFAYGFKSSYGAAWWIAGCIGR